VNNDINLNTFQNNDMSSNDLNFNQNNLNPYQGIVNNNNSLDTDGLIKYNNFKNIYNDDLNIKDLTIKKEEENEL
jgi:hypothetical protein